MVEDIPTLVTRALAVQVEVSHIAQAQVFEYA